MLPGLQITSTQTVSNTQQALTSLPIGVMRNALIFAGVAFLLALLLGRPVINFLIKNKIGKQIRIDGPQSHQVKMGTPTMGGLIILGTIALTTIVYLVIVNLDNIQSGKEWRYLSLLLPLGIILSFGILGGIDDLLSTVGRARGGIKARFKLAWLLIFSAVVALILFGPLGYNGIYIPLVGRFDISWFYVPVAILVVAGVANAVNFTDGLDSLASSTLISAFTAYGIIAYLQGQAPVVPFCFIIVGSLLGFIWFNAHPAQVFMGDIGSLTLGGLLATVAFMTGQWLLLPVIGIIFLAVGASSPLQVLYFKLTGGKRLFKMAPLHHHFELLGWSETQVMMRFFLISIVAAMIGVALALAPTVG